MLRHAMIGDGMDVLDAGTGSGYATALLCHRLGDRHVTSADVDPYLVKIAAERLAGFGLRPSLVAGDATGELPGTFDRIVATMSVRPVPPSWLTALRPGGRLVTTIAGTTAILTADKLDDGRAFGRIERDWAGFMPARHDDHAPPAGPARADISDAGEAPGRYPIVVVEDAWELATMLAIEHPGISTGHTRNPDGTLKVWLAHPDGSAAAATAARGGIPLVRQSGPRRLWDLLDDLRYRWLCDGSFPVYGAAAIVRRDGTIRLARGDWRASITEAAAQ